MKKTMFMLFAVVVLATACSKDKTDTPPPPPQISPVLGYWVGNYTTIGFLGSDNYAVLVKPGGIARIYDLGDKNDTTLIAAGAKGNGVWTLNGNIFQTSYQTGVKTVNTTTTVNAGYTNMTGTWAFGAGAVQGNISLSK